MIYPCNAIHTKIDITRGYVHSHLNYIKISKTHNATALKRDTCERVKGNMWLEENSMGLESTFFFVTLKKSHERHLGYTIAVVVVLYGAHYSILERQTD